MSAGERSRIGYCQQCIPERESDIQATIRDYLRWTGWYVVRHHQTLGSHVGLADLQAIKDGQVLMIEVKTRRGRQSQDQLEFELEEDVGSNRAVEVFIMNPFSPPYEEEPGYWSQDFLVGKAMWWWMEDEICSRCGAAVHSSDDLVLLGQNTGYIGVHRDCLGVMESNAIEQYLEGHE